MLYSEYVETKEITVKQLKIINHTFQNTPYSKAIRFRFTMQFMSIMSLASKMMEAD